ncbi:alpha/beta hydrolase [Sporosarcina sp. NCCP-2222]|uniref:alpha/beta hydrolase n=1 Tax=Sporosarcina sp. NCCP-2222 TaxID=2935073 RepID=UPI00208D80C2|nr:alpha/beta fold hydrolase [Sporosarcina sp. NCCP-2222]GKV55184.1 alpha/beta hydrolase [Sporosarcina sp. NCCP-2222]
MKRKIGIAIGSLAAILVVVLVIAGNYFYNQGVKRGTEVELHTESEAVNAVASDADQQLLLEAKEWFDSQERLPIEMKSFDGLRLHAQYIQHGDRSDKAVILAHGFRNSGDNMGKLAKMYYDLGFDVLLPDARGHGNSEGEYIGYGWHDRLDYKDWIDNLMEEHGTKQIILHGNSMGAATVLMTSGEKLPPEVKGIVADSAYSTVKEELTHQLKSIYNLPSFPLLQVTSIVTKIRAGYTFEEASALDQVKKNQVPLLLIHGDSDDLVPTEMAYELYDAAGGEKELWIVPNAGHTKAFDNGTAEYAERIQRFVEHVLAQ